MSTPGLEHIDFDKVPRHIAIIMDGNGRWAKSQGKSRAEGHKAGAEAVRKVLRTAVELKLEYLTIYTFSMENWNRPDHEVSALMKLFISTFNDILKEIDTFRKNGIRVNAIGEIGQLPKPCQTLLKKVMDVTKNHDKTTLTFALSYSSRWEIAAATKRIAEKVQQGELSPEGITEEVFAQHLCTANMPDPELLIRTSGEIRISNYLLWQLAYAELYFTPKMWPEFGGEDLVEAVQEYQRRERRFGLTSEQLKGKL